MYEEEIKNLEAQTKQGQSPSNLFGQVKDLADKVVFEADFLKCFRLAKVIDEIFSKAGDNLSLNLRNELSGLAVKLKFLSLPRWPDSVVAELFEDGLGSVLTDEDVMAATRLQAKLIEIPSFLRDEFKQTVIRHLRENQELISDKKIEIEGKPASATISNILRDYLNLFGDKPTSNVEFAAYFMKSKNYKALPEAGQNKVKELLKIFDMLSKSSFTPEGLENAILYMDRDGVMKMLDHGVITIMDSGIKAQRSFQPLAIPQEKQQPVSQKQKAIEAVETVEAGPEQEILLAYQGDPKQQKAISKEEEKIKAKFGSDLKKVRSEFFASIQKQSTNRAIALFRVLAQNDDLGKFIKQDEKLNKFLAAVWEKQYGKGLVKKFKKNPDQVKFIRLFLKYVLQERLGLNNNDSARIGLQIANILVGLGKKNYNKVAYFDVKSREFKWFD